MSSQPGLEDLDARPDLLQKLTLDWPMTDLNLQDVWIKWMKMVQSLTKMKSKKGLVMLLLRQGACIVDLRSKCLFLDLGLLVLTSRQLEIETCPYLISLTRGLLWKPYQHANLFREVQVDLKTKCGKNGKNMPSYLHDQWCGWMINVVALWWWDKNMYIHH